MDAGYYSSEINIIRDACSLNDICGWYRQGQILWESGNTVETVVLLSKGMVDSRKVKVDFSLEDMDLSEFKGKATYEQIKAYVLEQTELKVSSLYIAQIKKKCGLDVGENFNLPKSENARQPQCTQEKEDAFMQAFRHFGIIQIVDKQHRVLKIQ